MMATMARGPLKRGDHPAALHAILNPDCALAIWNRPMPPMLADHISRLDPETMDYVDATIRANAASIEAAVLLGAAGYEGATAVALATEIGDMAACLSLITSARNLRIRLEIVETDACRRFHADMVTIRLLLTLHGPGTQWIETTTPDAIEQVPTGAVAIFKGRLLADDPAVLHRSPPIAGTGRHRLVLAIDPVESGRE